MDVFSRPLKLLGSGGSELTPDKNAAINEDAEEDDSFFYESKQDQNQILSAKSVKQEEKEEELFLIKSLGAQPISQLRRASVATINEEEADRMADGRSSDDSFCTDSSGDSILKELEESDLNERDKALQK